MAYGYGMIRVSKNGYGSDCGDPEIFLEGALFVAGYKYNLSFLGMDHLLVRFTQGIFGNDPFHHIRNFIIPATPSNPSSNPA